LTGVAALAQPLLRNLHGDPMQITSIFSSIYASSLQNASSARATARPVAAASGGSGNASGVSSDDFTNMTPTQLQTTINSLVKSGKLSLKDSSPLVSIAGFANGSSPVNTADMSGKPIDVLSALQAGITDKEQNQAGEPNSGVQCWKNALTMLQGLQGTPSGVDAFA
jgi:hypothetical protein